MHLILRSTRAAGEWNFLRTKNQVAIDAILEKLVRRYGIRIMGFENVGNHLHVLVQGKSRTLLRNFLRTLPAQIAAAITGAKKGNSVGRFFDTIFFSRVVEWGRDFLRLKDYFTKNRLEAVEVDQRFIDWWNALARDMRA